MGRVQTKLLDTLAWAVLSTSLVGGSALGGTASVRRAGILPVDDPLPPAAFQLPEDPRPAIDKVSATLFTQARRSDGPLDVLVTLREPPALRTLSPLAAPRQRWAETTVRELEREYAGMGVTVLRTYRHLPVMRMHVLPVSLQVLAGDRRVERIAPNRRVHALDREGNQLMNVPALHSLGFRGQGVGVAVLDTGVDYRHPELSPGGTNPATSKTILLWDAVNNDTDPMDREGHGTSVAGIVAGKERGVAPEAKIVAVRVLDEQGEGTEDQILDGIDAVLESIAAGNPYNIKVANLSLGGYDDDEWPPKSGTCDELDPAAAAAFERLTAAGVAIFVAAGNGGCTEGVAWPACLSQAMAVGAVYDDEICTQELPLLGCVSHTQYFGAGQCQPNGCHDDYKADRIACYSDSGDKLDIWAPSDCARTAGRNDETVECFNGTSAAAPYAAGVAALLTQAMPGRTVTALTTALRSTGKPLRDSRNNITRNRVDAQAALALLQSCAPPTTPTALRTNKLSVCANEEFTLSWDAVSGVASYTVAVATDSDFQTATERVVTGTSAVFAVNATTPATLYARVRANADCGAPSEWSPSLRIAYNPSCGSPSYSHTYFVSGVAHTPGVPPAVWFTDLSVFNLSPTPAELRLAFYGTASSPAYTATLPALQQLTWRDVLSSLFQLPSNDVGVVVVESTQRLAVVARTYSRLGEGPSATTYGQSYEGLEVGHALTGLGVGYLTGLRSDGVFRTNVEVVNVGSVPATFEVRFFSAAGVHLKTVSGAVAVNRRTAVTAALPPGSSDAFAEVRITPLDAKVIAFASVIDGNSTDPTTIPLAVP